MRDLRAMLAGLKEEERGAVALAKENVGDIRAEIKRVEDLISHQPSQADQAAADHPALAGPSERHARELAALREELAGVKPGDTARKADIEAEIARLDRPADVPADAPAPAKRTPPGK